MSSLCTTISPSIVITGAGGRFVVVVRARNREMISSGGRAANFFASTSIILLNRNPLATMWPMNLPVVCSAPVTMCAAVWRTVQVPHSDGSAHWSGVNPASVSAIDARWS